MRGLWVLVAVSLLACSGRTDRQAAVDSIPPGDTSWTVSPGGFGPLHVGATISQLDTVLQGSVVRHFMPGESCGHITSHRLPAGVRVMILGDVAVRIEIDSTGVATAEGAQVGDAEQRVLAMYGDRARVTPHKYTGPQGHYIVVTVPGDTMSRIVFETDGLHVLNYRAGRRPAVDFVEGCA